LTCLHPHPVSRHMVMSSHTLISADGQFVYRIGVSDASFRHMCPLEQILLLTLRFLTRDCNCFRLLCLLITIR